MATPTAHRRLVIYVVLLGCGLAVCGWQVEEHARFKRDAAQALINRGRDITSTLGVLVRSQRRFGIVSKERLQSGLQDLIRPGELESLAILSAAGEIVANAGHPVLELRRLAYGPFALGELAPGEWRALSDDEIDPLGR